MRKFIILFILTMVYIATIAAPALPSTGMPKPKVFTDDLLKKSAVLAFLNSPNFTPNSLSNKVWVVYSDRDNNPTFMQPSFSSAQCTTLKFNETLKVAKVQNGFALVYVDPIVNTSNIFGISSEAVCKGWVHMSRLLLWSSALANDQGIYYKALLCRSLDNADQSARELPTTTCYFAPSKEAKSTEIPSDMNFYFVMKEVGNMVLLAKHRALDASASDKMLIGWIERDAFAPWNQRSCAEPTWTHEDVEYFADKNINIQFYDNKSLTGKEISNIKFTRKSYERRPKYIYRMKGNDLRYPILDDNNSSVYNLSTFKTFGNKNSQGGLSDLDSIKLNAFKKQQRINLAIVIDGTKSMEPYYPAVKEAIKQGCNYFNSDKYTLKVGIVIYRDYADGEQGLAEVLPLTNVRNIDRINDFLDSGGSYGIKSASSDKTEAEALYYGINEAMDKLKFKEGESNMMLIVGDCGNDLRDNTITRESLVQKMSAKEMHLMGFQVRNLERDTYSDFNSQIMWLIRNTLLSNYKTVDKSGTTTVSHERVLNSEGHNEGNNYKANITKQLYLGSYSRALSNINNGMMDPAKLTVHMTGAISSFATTIQEQIDLLEQKAGNILNFEVDPNNVDLNVEVEFLKKRLGADYVSKLKNAQVITFKGYTPRKSINNKPFFKPIIFIAETELSALLKRMEPVAKAAMLQDARNRKPYFEAMKALLRSLAPGLTEAEMGGLTNNQITKMIGGLNEAPSSLTTYKLDDLTNSQVIPDEKYLSILKDFADKYNNLRYVFGDTRYEYKRVFGSITYYWLPIQMLP